tara:strand:- start:680 stop:892 length:213 start_codon:yes stop_codon:yes gene_type:complete
MEMDKVNEMLIGTLAVVGGFITKRIFSNNDTLANRITALEKVVATKSDLEPIQRNVDIILNHILNNTSSK